MSLSYRDESCRARAYERKGRVLARPAGIATLERTGGGLQGRSPLTALGTARPRWKRFQMSRY
jgi:hypothetical protein